MFFTNLKKRHYFNHVHVTPWPFLIGMSLFNIVFLTILMLNKYYLFDVNVSLVILFFLFYMMIEFIFAWVGEVMQESYFGKYTKKLRSALVFGFLLFLLSEAFLFGSFFWSYFDRLFHLSYSTGFLSVPTTVETIRWFKEPLYATIVLLASGLTANYAYYLYQLNDVNSLKKAYFLSAVTNLLGCVFMYIQYLEYNHLSFTISDTVYCSVFYALTGFHGLHVIIGNLFLYCQYYIKFYYRDNKAYGLGMAVLYWHFVDIIWIFLFLSVYCFNNIDYFVCAEIKHSFCK